MNTKELNKLYKKKKLNKVEEMLLRRYLPEN